MRGKVILQIFTCNRSNFQRSIYDYSTMLNPWNYRLLLCILLCQWGLSQSMSGRVTDADTGVRLGYCNISIENTTRGTATNSDGYYSIKLPPGSYRIRFQYLGYQSESVEVNITTIPLNLDIMLHPQVVSLDPITVYANQKTEVENLILKASRMKRKSRFIKNYYCHSYTKTSYRSSFDPALYGGIFETFSELYFNAPDTWHEVLLSQRQSANLPESVNFVSGNTFLDVNSDRIQLGGHTIVGPTAPDAVDYYTFEILDTLYQDHNRIFRIQFSPNNKRIPAMSGELFLVDKFFIINHIDAVLNEMCNYDLFENIHILQRYTALNDSIYLPNYALRENDFVLGIPGTPTLLMRKENFRENYRVNDLQNRISPEADAVEILPAIPFKMVPMFIPPLTMDEAVGYEVIDSMVVLDRRLKNFTRIVKLIDIYSNLNGKPIGEIADFIHFNRVEGLFTGLALDTKSLVSPFALQMGAGYGYSDAKPKFYLTPSVEWGNRAISMKTSLKWYQTLAVIEEPADFPVMLNSFRGAFEGFDYYDYYYSTGHQLEMDINYSHLNLTAAILQETHSTASVTQAHGLFTKPKFLDNPVISSGDLAGVKVQATISNIKYLKSNLSKRLIPNQHFTQLEVGYETGLTAWDSDFSYDRYLMILTTRRNLFTSVLMDMRLETGFSHGALPRQKFFEVQGGSADFDLLKSFSTLDQNSLFGSQKLALFTEFNFGNIFYRWGGVPILQAIPWNVSIITHTGWAGEKQLNQLTLPDMYTEAGVGINNVFNLFKIELMFSAVETDYSQPFTLTVKIEDFDIF